MGCARHIRTPIIRSAAMTGRATTTVAVMTLRLSISEVVAAMPKVKYGTGYIHFSMGKFDLVVFDLDGVLVDSRSSWEWVHRHFGVDNEASLTAYLQGEIDDMEFMRRDIALWRAKEPRITRKRIGEIVQSAPLMPGLSETIAALKKAGIKRVIISGGLRQMAERAASAAEFNSVFANDIECGDDGSLTGNGISVVPLGAKDEVLQRVLDEMGVAPEKCAVVGDSLVDVPMFEIAGLGIAFNPRDNYTKDGADVIINVKDLREILKHILE